MCGRGFGSFIFPALAGVLAAESLTSQTGPSQQVHAKAVCPACLASVQSNFEWCPQCGQSLRTQPPAPNQQPSCAYCGRALAAGAQFCTSCGAPVGRQPANK